MIHGKDDFFSRILTEGSPLFVLASWEQSLLTVYLQFREMVSVQSINEQLLTRHSKMEKNWCISVYAKKKQP